jgi:hypothetical protein
MPPKAVFDVARAAALHAEGMPLAQVSKLPGMPCPATLKTHLLECGYEVWKGPWKMRTATKEQLHELHHVRDMSSADIGKMFGCGASSVRRKLVALGIPKGAGKHRPPKGAEHWSWRGGRYRNPKGYVFLRDPDHPQAMKTGYVAEHRMVAYEVLGKKLHTKDEVHHLNGNHGDNRPENLIVVKHGKHQKLHANVLKELYQLRAEVARLGGARAGDNWKVVG